MAKKKKQEKDRQTPQLQPGRQQQAINIKPPLKESPLRQTGVTTVVWYKNSTQLITVLAILAITFICFSPAISSKKLFINFDDPVYITKQDLITKLDAPHLKRIFSQHDASLNYHPLT